MSPSVSEHRTQGFTLVEVLVALAVLAIALTAVMRVTAQSIDTSFALRERNLATWVAQNRLALHRLENRWPAVDTIDGDSEFADRTWYWRERVSTTPQANIRRIEIAIRSNADDRAALARLVGYLRKPDGKS
jgi:general secretion pathway protein I